MSFLGIGPFELLLLLVIATVVLGPERMAQAGRTLGRLYARYRLRWQKDVDEMTRELRRELALLQQEVDQIKQTAESEIKTAQAEDRERLNTQRLKYCAEARKEFELALLIDEKRFNIEEVLKFRDFVLEKIGEVDEETRDKILEGLRRGRTLRRVLSQS